MSVNHSERSFKPSDFIKGGGDAGSEQSGNTQVQLVYSPVSKPLVRPPKPKSIFGQYRSLSRKSGFVPSSVVEKTDVKYHTSPKKIKKASSMEDLTPEKRKTKEPSRVKRTMSLTPARIRAKQGLQDPLATTKLLASRRIFQALILNAWRKRRSYVAILITERENYVCEVRNLNLQITLLKTLLESEKDRSNTASAQLKDVTDMLDDVTEELQLVRRDKEEIYMKLACQDLHQEDIEAKFNHVKKELHVAKSANCELTKRLESSEEYISNLKEKNSSLLTQLASQNDRLVARVESMRNLQLAKTELEKRLSAEVRALVATMKEKEDAMSSVTRMQEEVDMKNGELSAAAKEKEALLEKIRELLRALRDHGSEIQDLKNRIEENDRQSWSHQLRNAVSLVAHLFSRVVLLAVH